MNTFNEYIKFCIRFYQQKDLIVQISSNPSMIPEAQTKWCD